MLETARDWFWSSDIWLPPEYDWADLDNRNGRGINYPDTHDLVYPIALGLVVLGIRYITEAILLIPFGKLLGIHDKPRRALENIPILEAFYHKSKSTKLPDHKEVQGLAKKTNLSVRQGERWLRKRRSLDQPSKLTKFSECGWKFLFKASKTFFGMYVLSNKSWTWNIGDCWHEYPHQDITPELWWYYMVALAFNWSLIFSQWGDTRRKDFWPMLVHHGVTICLLAFSWICNFVRIGILISVLHDFADVLLEVTKMAMYASRTRASNIFFGVFTLVWVLTRLWVYPVHILQHTIFETPKLTPLFPAYHIFNGMLIGLMVLHVFWSYFIFRMAIKGIMVGVVDKDGRSSESSECSDGDHMSKSDTNSNPSLSTTVMSDGKSQEVPSHQNTKN